MNKNYLFAHEILHNCELNEFYTITIQSDVTFTTLKTILNKIKTKSKTLNSNNKIA